MLQLSAPTDGIKPQVKGPLEATPRGAERVAAVESCGGIHFTVQGGTGHENRLRWLLTASTNGPSNRSPTATKMSERLCKRLNNAGAAVFRLHPACLLSHLSIPQRDTSRQTATPAGSDRIDVSPDLPDCRAWHLGHVSLFAGRRREVRLGNQLFVGNEQPVGKEAEGRQAVQQSDGLLINPTAESEVTGYWTHELPRA